MGNVLDNTRLYFFENKQFNFRVVNMTEVSHFVVTLWSVVYNNSVVAITFKNFSLSAGLNTSQCKLPPDVKYYQFNIK